MKNILIKLINSTKGGFSVVAPELPILSDLFTLFHAGY